jgi:hypothetical protein
MPRCFCGEELQANQTDMCSTCFDAVADTLEDFDPPEGVAGHLNSNIPIAGIVMPLEKALREVDE